MVVVRGRTRSTNPAGRPSTSLARLTPDGLDRGLVGGVITLVTVPTNGVATPPLTDYGA